VVEVRVHPEEETLVMGSTFNIYCGRCGGFKRTVFQEEPPRNEDHTYADSCIDYLKTRIEALERKVFNEPGASSPGEGPESVRQ
jgi:hypothetical protein